MTIMTMFNNAAYPYAKERYEAWKKRDLQSYCPNHPMILPENDEKIRWEAGTVTNKDGTVEKFSSCPKCHMTLETWERLLGKENVHMTAGDTPINNFT